MAANPKTQKMTSRVINQTCDICHKSRARYDAPTISGPWAYMCPTCYGIEGRIDHGTILRWESDEPACARIEPPSMEELEEMVFDGIAYARCEHGCEVEPDGYCEHGKPSWLLVFGLI